MGFSYFIIIFLFVFFSKYRIVLRIRRRRSGVQNIFRARVEKNGRFLLVSRRRNLFVSAGENPSAHERGNKRFVLSRLCRNSFCSQSFFFCLKSKTFPLVSHSGTYSIPVADGYSTTRHIRYRSLEVQTTRVLFFFCFFLNTKHESRFEFISSVKASIVKLQKSSFIAHSGVNRISTL